MSAQVSTKLVALRKERAVSQKDAAAALGVSQALLSHYEKGIRECGLDFLRRAADYYDVSTDYLLGITNNRVQADAFLEKSDLPQDRELRISTVFRAASQLFELLSSCGYSEKVTEIYILTLYKMYICAVNQGVLPANDMLHPEIIPYLSNSVLDYAVTEMMKKSDKPKKISSTPVCVNTVTDEALKIIKNHINALHKISSDR